MSPLSEAAVAWLVDGEHGLSSMAMFHRLALGREVDPFHYPHDIDDYQRCERLLRGVPELRERLGEMASVSPIWPSLIAAWPELVRLLDEDAPGLLDIGWDAVPYGTRRVALTRAETIFRAASDEGYRAYRATRDSA